MAARTKNLPELEMDQGVSLEVGGSIIGCSGRQARRLAERGDLQAYKVGNRTWRTTPRACLEFMQKGGSRRGGDE
jgi:hypothetical protein